MTSHHENGPDAPASGPFSARLRGVTLTLVSLVTIIAFESMAVSTIMPGVAAALRSTAGYGLAFSAMFIAQLFSIVAAGPVIERLGPFLPITLGQCVFAVGSLLAGVAPTFGMLLLGRVVAGVGSGLVVVALYVVIGAVYSSDVRPRVFGWVSAAWVLPSIVGPAVAATVAEVWSWRVVFLAVLPVVAATSWGLARARASVRSSLRRPSPDPDSPAPAESDDDASGTRRTSGRTVALGAVVALGAGACQWAGTLLTPPSVGAAVFAVAGVVALAWSVPRLLPPGSLVLQRGLPAVTLARGLFTAAFAGSVAFIPLLLVAHRGFGERAAGVVLALSSIGWSGAAALLGRPRFAGHSARFVVIGALALTAGTATLAASAAFGLPPWALVVGSALLGLGMGFGTTSISVLTLDLATASNRASASSAMTLSDTLGSALGVTVTATAFAALTGEVEPAPVAAFTVLWCATTVIGGAAVIAALRARPPQRAST